MGDVKLTSTGGGSVTLTPPSTASNYTVTLPAANTTLADTSSTQTLTNKTLTAAGSNTVEATSGPTSTQLAGQRNKIINGAMMIDQRNAGASVTPADTAYTLDRWTVRCSQSSKFSVQQNAGSVTPPVGFVNYLGVTSLSSYSVGSSDFFTLIQYIEGFNCADLAWGTANAKSITLSFQVYSSLTGTFGGSLTSGDNNRSYPFTFSISSANTWTTASITIAGDTSGTWLKDSGRGIGVRFNLGAKSTYSGTAGAWASATYYSATGAQSVVGTNGATFYITGVQLEKGASATPFENRLYGTELALCQRYFEHNYSTGYAIGSAGSYPNNTGVYINGFTASSGQKIFSTPYRVQKRTIPTVTYYDVAGNAGKISKFDAGGTATNNQALAATYLSDVVQGCGGTDGTNTGVGYFYVSSAEL